MIKINRFKLPGGKSLMCGAAMLVLSACAGTPNLDVPEDAVASIYHQNVKGEDAVRISYEGNLLKDPARVQDYLYYRAAKLAVDSGYDRVTLQPIETDAEKTRIFKGGIFKQDSPYVRYSFFQPKQGWTRDDRLSAFHASSQLPDGSHRFVNKQAVLIKLDEITKVRAYAQVQFNSGEAPSVDKVSYDAREYLDKNEDRFTYINSKVISPTATKPETDV